MSNSGKIQSKKKNKNKIEQEHKNQIKSNKKYSPLP
jgi:hypothetical protein